MAPWRRSWSRTKHPSWQANHSCGSDPQKPRSESGDRTKGRQHDLFGIRLELHRDLHPASHIIRISRGDVRKHPDALLKLDDRDDIWNELCKRPLDRLPDHRKGVDASLPRRLAPLDFIG